MSTRLSKPLFDSQPRMPLPTARPITCLVCSRPGQSDGARPALCQECGADVAAARGFVVNLVLASKRRVEATMAAYFAAVNAAPPALLGRLSNYQDARMVSNAKAAQAETQARSGRDEPLLNLIRLWLDYQDAGERYAEVQAWSVRCEAVLS